MKITKTMFGRLMKKVSKEHGFDYYNYFECCNSCFTANLPEGRPYMYLKYCRKGMNYETSANFDKRKEWCIAYSDALFPKLATIFDSIKVDLDAAGVMIEFPDSSNKCVIINDKRIR